MHIHALCLRHRDGRNATHVAVAPGRVFSPDFQPCTRLTLLVTGAGVFAIIRFGHEAGHRVAAGWVDFAGDDAHLLDACGLFGETSCLKKSRQEVVVLAADGS